MNRQAIYLISDTGAARTNDERSAQALEQFGYHRCSIREFAAKRKEQARQDAAAAYEQHRRFKNRAAMRIKREHLSK